MIFRDIQQQQVVTTKSIAKYMLLPGILPRLKHLAFVMSKMLFIFVQIFGRAGLIDPNHPCLRYENIGQYSFGAVVALAWSNVRFTRETMPQAILFCSVIATLVLMIAMFLSGGAYFFTNLTSQAHAQYYGSATNSIVTNYDVQNDWALQFLDRVFGDSTMTGIDFWTKGARPTMGGNPWFTSLLAGMFKVYSKALLFIAIIMIFYLIMITLVDAARSGKPFGGAFDSVWAPIRFALALGMLVPVSGGGYNGAQMLAFQAAEWGSNLATNMWQHGLQSIGGKPGQDLQYVSAEVSDPGYKFVRDMFLINLCVNGYNQLLAQGELEEQNIRVSVEPVVTNEGESTLYSFGVPDFTPDFCGTVSIPNEPDVPDDFLTTSANNVSGIPQNNAQARTKADYLPVKLSHTYNDGFNLFFGANSLMSDASFQLVKGAFCSVDKDFMETKCSDGKLCSNQVQDWIYAYWRTALGREGDPNTTVGTYSAANDYFLANFKPQLNKYNQWLSDGLFKDAGYGWASAGVFYLRMSSALSALDKSVHHAPVVVKRPANYDHMFATVKEPELSDEDGMLNCGMNAASEKVCKQYEGSVALWRFMHKGADFFASAPKSKIAGNKGLDFYMKAGGFAWDAELKMAQNEDTTNYSLSDVWGPIQQYIFKHFIIIPGGSLNPLGQVIDWGNKMLETAAVAQGLAVAADAYYYISGSEKAHTFATFAQWVSEILIIPGFTLMFVIPILPFMYFTFAIIEWIASVIEAVIGMPLWALSFITMRGDVFEPMKNGALMLLEIVLRPTVTVMALIGSILIFTGTVAFLNDSMLLYFDAFSATANSNITALGSHFFGGLGLLIVYMFLIYLLALSCFQIIDIIPKHFGRWLEMPQGFNASTKIGASAFAISAASAYVASYGGMAVREVSRDVGAVLGMAGGAATGGVTGFLKAGYRSGKLNVKEAGATLSTLEAGGHMSAAEATEVARTLKNEGLIHSDDADNMIAYFRKRAKNNAGAARGGTGRGYQSAQTANTTGGGNATRPAGGNTPTGGGAGNNIPPSGGTP